MDDDGLMGTCMAWDLWRGIIWDGRTGKPLFCLFSRFFGLAIIEQWSFYHLGLTLSLANPRGSMCIGYEREDVLLGWLGGLLRFLGWWMHVPAGVR